MTISTLGWDGNERIMNPRETWARRLTFLGLMLCMAGLVTSPALLSIGTITMILPAFAALPLREQLRRFFWNKPFLLISLILIVQILSALWTREEQVGAWLEQVKVKLPLLFGLYSVAVMGPFSRKEIRLALIVLLLSVVFIGAGTLVDYILHKEEIDHRIQISKEVQVWLGINHIYFSIISGFSVIAGVWLAQFRQPLRWKFERPVIIGLSLFVFVLMHVLTTRTGLVGLYLTGGLIGFVYVLYQKKYLIGLLAFLFVGSLPVVGYHSVPSFQHRIDNTWMDVSRYFSGKDPNYLSIGTRLESWKTAVNIFRKQPLLGVAMADIKADMTDQYVADKTLLCPENFILPHNQFLRYLAGFGLLGTLPFLIGWFWLPLWKKVPKDWIFWAFWLTFSLAMMGESTLERQVGIMFMVTCLSLTLSAGVRPQNR
ncbi:MAG TPA: O-antigen ligase family protein [Bacteroidetes bacterium]|nr:O-antigen ligase family protein [Bacteroidota bacterium]